jgi:hypothetical protein
MLGIMIYLQYALMLLRNGALRIKPFSVNSIMH